MYINVIVSCSQLASVAKNVGCQLNLVLGEGLITIKELINTSLMRWPLLSSSSFHCFQAAFIKLIFLKKKKERSIIIIMLIFIGEG